MKLEVIIGGAVLVIFGLVIAWLIFKRVPRKLKTNYFTFKWKELQQLCKDKQTWPQAIISADKLFDEALKKKHFKGKSMGERMVSAQRLLNNNDGVWYAHNLRKKLVDDANQVLKEADVKKALMGIRQALKDLGAFEDDRSKES